MSKIMRQEINISSRDMNHIIKYPFSNTYKKEVDMTDTSERTPFNL